MAPTNTQGARVKITDLRRNESKTIVYNYEYDNVVDMAQEFLSNRNIFCQGFIATDKTDILFSTDFGISIVEPITV